MDDEKSIVEEVWLGDFDAIDEDFFGGETGGGVDGSDGEAAVGGESLDLGTEG